jgi:hypothetical protein
VILEDVSEVFWCKYGEDIPPDNQRNFGLHGFFNALGSNRRPDAYLSTALPDIRPKL